MAKKRHYSSRRSERGYGKEHAEVHHDFYNKTERESGHERSDERDIYRPDKYSGYYEGPESRRYEEMRDAGMIQEDRSAIANLPQNVMIKPYPMNKDYIREGLDDTIRGIDGQIDLDGDRRDKDFHPKKV